MIGETEAERRERLNRSNTKFARDVCDRLFPDDQVWWELEMKNTLGIKSHEASNDGVVASEFKAFGGNVLPYHRRKSQEIPSPQKIPSPKRAPPGRSNFSSSSNTTSPKKRSEKPKEKKEDDISLQMQEMSIDSPGILEERQGSNDSKGELGRLMFQSSMDGQAMSLDFIMSSNSPYVSKSPAVTN